MRSVVGKHLLFGPDGNRRYAVREGLSFAQAYAQIPSVCLDLCRRCLDANAVGTVSLWLLQEYNLKREGDQAELLTHMVRDTVRTLCASEDARRWGVSLTCFSSELDRAVPGTTDWLREWASSLAVDGASRINVILAYNPDRELLAALRRCEAQGAAPSFGALARNWCIPPVDLFLRTGQVDGMSNLSAYWPGIERARILSTAEYPLDLDDEELRRLFEIYESGEDALSQCVRREEIGCNGSRDDLARLSIEVRQRHG